MVESEAYLGSYAENPLKFQHLGVELIGFCVSGETCSKTTLLDECDTQYIPSCFLILYGPICKIWEGIDTGITREMQREGMTSF